MSTSYKKYQTICPYADDIDELLEESEVWEVLYEAYYRELKRETLAYLNVARYIATRLVMDKHPEMYGINHYEELESEELRKLLPDAHCWTIGLSLAMAAFIITRCPEGISPYVIRFCHDTISTSYEIREMTLKRHGWLGLSSCNHIDLTPLPQQDSANEQTTSPADAAKLQQDIEARDQEIAQLKQQIADQEAQIAGLKKRPATTPPADGVTELDIVVRILDYAEEQYPAEQNEKAKVVKELLQDLFSDMLDKKTKARLKKLGTKSQAAAKIGQLVMGDGVQNIRTALGELPGTTQKKLSDD